MSRSDTQPALDERLGKIYSAAGEFRAAAPISTVWVQSGTERYRLPHLVRHSPDGFGWGYAGSAPTELARSLLADLLGAAPARWLYLAFRNEVIESLDQDAGFTLSEDSVRAWLATQGGKGSLLEEEPW